jgi:putative addiction module CopG family antidote
MELNLRPELLEYIQGQVSAGRFASAQEVIEAALAAMGQHESEGDFAPGELEELIAEGEHSITEEGTLDGKEAFDARVKRRQIRRSIAG